MQHELPTRLAKEKLAEHDLPGLHTLIGAVHGKLGKEISQHWLRVSVLANAPHEDARWFWQQSLGERGETVFETIVKVCLKKLRDVDEFDSSVDYLVTTAVDELPVMLVTPEVRHYLLDALPVERHGSLNALLMLNNDTTSKLQPEFRRSGDTSGGTSTTLD